MPRTLLKTAAVGAALLTTIALAACASGSPAASTTATGTWGDASESTEPSLALADDGTLTGTDGCNRLIGGWTQDGDTVEFGEVASTRMACADVDTWLSGLASATIAGDTLTILDVNGEEIGTLDRTSSEAESAAVADEAAYVSIWGSDTESTDPNVTILDDGTLSGTDGCNSFAGSWTFEGDKIEFGELAVTLKACEGVDEWLSGMASATVDGDTLTFFNADGAEIGTLPRA